MADRSRANPHANMQQQQQQQQHYPPPRPTTNAPASSSSIGGVRRNLFQGQLTRRPTATAASSSTAAAGNSNSNSGGGASSSSHSAEALGLDVDVLSDTSEIIVRDQHGEVELGDPPTPGEEDEDEVQLDDRQENEKERQRLAEAVKHHQINHTAVRDQPEELLEAVRASLRAKVAALAEDNWMFEAEEPSRAS